MFVIRKANVEALRRAAVDDFEARMVAHLRRVFPEACGGESDAALLARVKLAIERAGRWGVELEYDVCLYLHVMVALGDRFDEAPEHAALRAILEEKRGAPSRVNDLHDRVFEPDPDDALVDLEA